MSETLTKLDEAHFRHLLDEGFTEDEILTLEGYGVKSISRAESRKLDIKKWDGSKYITDGGLYFPFYSDQKSEYGQVRFNTPLKIPGEKPIKYLGPSKPTKVWYPEPDIKALTEGWKDGAKPTVLGVPTGAIVGVDNIIHCMPQDCRTPIIFDSDGWRKPDVVRALVWGALWMNSRINLFPPMAEYPDGGACEFFKSGGTVSEYQDLIDNAMRPDEFLAEWASRIEKFDDENLRMQCVRVGAELCHTLRNANKFVKNLEIRVADRRQKWIEKLS